MSSGSKLPRVSVTIRSTRVCADPPSPSLSPWHRPAAEECVPCVPCGSPTRRRCWRAFRPTRHRARALSRGRHASLTWPRRSRARALKFCSVRPSATTKRGVVRMAARSSPPSVLGSPRVTRWCCPLVLGGKGQARRNRSATVASMRQRSASSNRNRVLEDLAARPDGSCSSVLPRTGRAGGDTRPLSSPIGRSRP
jgi:hypothetical protein